MLPHSRCSHWVAVVCSTLLASMAHGGGGAQDVAVVVNQDSWASQAVANHYVRLRNVPAANVIHLSNVPGPDQTTVDEFRDRILTPVLRTIRERGLSNQITTIAYSADFPWGVQVRSDYAGQELPKVFTTTASINGLTYLYEDVLAPAHHGYIRLNANRYVRMAQSASLPGVSRAIAPLLLQAGNQMRAKKWDAAEESLRAANEKQPGHALIQYNLACCLAQQKQFDQAMDALASAVKNGWSRREALEDATELAPLRKLRAFEQLLATMPKTSRCEPSLAFDHHILWSPQRRPMRPPTQFFPPLESSEQAAVLRQRASRYMLSTVLGITSGRGNSIQEVLNCLTRSVAADHTQPTGSIYFPTNANIRSKTREPLYAAAVAELKSMGVTAESKPGVLPQNKQDVAGAMIGTATFDWEKSGSRMLPGAICEHLTSLGGVMRENGGQTPLTEFIRHGAAGSSGTVTEPYAIQAKFPLPFLHVHYARGCSLAESFYQSVAGPYQLLIVGDPLCQPWSQPPKFTVEGLPKQPIKRGTTLRLKLVMEQDSLPIIGAKCFIDGQLAAASLRSDTLTVPTTALQGGIHQLRVVAYGDSKVRPQGSSVFPLEVDARQQCSLSLESEEATYGDKLAIRLASTGKVIRAELRHQSRTLGKTSGEAPSWEIDSTRLGIGKSLLTAVVLHSDGAVVRGAPLEVDIRPPTVIRPLTNAPDDLKPGLAVYWDTGEIDHVTSTSKADWLTALNPPKGSKLLANGYYQAAESGLHQLQIQANFPLTLQINGQTLFQQTQASANWHYLPVPLETGDYRLEINGKPTERPRLMMRFGLRGAQSFNERFRHAP